MHMLMHCLVWCTPRYDALDMMHSNVVMCATLSAGESSREATCQGGAGEGSGRALRSGTLDLTSGTLDPTSGTLDLKSGTLDLTSGSLDLTFG